MIVKFKSRSEEVREESYNYGDTIEIEVDGKDVFSAHDGEPEDNTLSRNFNDCYKIDELMRMAWESGKRGEDFTILTENIEE